ncbi:hypothetical protein NDU88_000915 [Pleurodeles waltl]|uniref:Uncharacterized protein n=1 Tax=Pleurodeles waltl TaxID=8319 RepID=A0AAV7VYL8_PLEWA|nr:hypothetical protein NDU88_000915 [Pleurodeles waltl]
MSVRLVDPTACVLLVISLFRALLVIPVPTCPRCSCSQSHLSALLLLSVPLVRVALARSAHCPCGSQCPLSVRLAVPTVSTKGCSEWTIGQESQLKASLGRAVEKCLLHYYERLELDSSFIWDLWNYGEPKGAHCDVDPYCMVASQSTITVSTGLTEKVAQTDTAHWTDRGISDHTPQATQETHVARDNTLDSVTIEANLHADGCKLEYKKEGT